MLQCGRARCRAHRTRIPQTRILAIPALPSSSLDISPGPLRACRRACCLSLLTLLPRPALAAGSRAGLEQAYNGYAPRYDELNAGPLARAVGFDELRASLLAQASGSVLEVAVGTGLNLPLYDWQQVKSVRAVDLSEGMLAQAQARITALPSLQTHQDDITLSQDNAESLSMGDNSFDCVVDTYSLCVLEHPLAALKEMARVVRPSSEGGRVLLLEHARAELPLLGWYQDVSAATVAATSKGCMWNQDVPALLTAAGLRVIRLSRHTGGTVVMVEAVRDA